MKHRDIDSCGHGGDAVGWQVKMLLKSLSDAAAGGDDMIRQRGIRVPAQPPVGNPNIEMARADNERNPSKPSGESYHPAVTRTMCVEDVRPAPPEPSGSLQCGDGEAPLGNVVW